MKTIQQYDQFGLPTEVTNLGEDCIEVKQFQPQNQYKRVDLANELQGLFINEECDNGEVWESSKNSYQNRCQIIQSQHLRSLSARGRELFESSARIIIENSLPPLSKIVLMMEQELKAELHQFCLQANHQSEYQELKSYFENPTTDRVSQRGSWKKDRGFVRIAVSGVIRILFYCKVVDGVAHLYDFVIFDDHDYDDAERKLIDKIQESSSDSMDYEFTNWIGKKEELSEKPFEDTNKANWSIDWEDPIKNEADGKTKVLIKTNPQLWMNWNGDGNVELAIKRRVLAEYKKNPNLILQVGSEHFRESKKFVAISIILRDKLWENISDESIEEGAAGDWEKEGYVIHQSNLDPNDSKAWDAVKKTKVGFEIYKPEIDDFYWVDGNHVEDCLPDIKSGKYKIGSIAPLVWASDKNGNPVGAVVAQKDGEILETSVLPEHRRKGLASAMYSRLEKILKTKVHGGLSQSDDAKKLWSQPNRPFGESKYSEFGIPLVENLHGQLHENTECGKGNIWEKRQKNCLAVSNQINRKPSSSLASESTSELSKVLEILFLDDQDKKRFLEAVKKYPMSQELRDSFLSWCEPPYLPSKVEWYLKSKKENDEYCSVYVRLKLQKGFSEQPVRAVFLLTYWEGQPTGWLEFVDIGPKDLIQKKYNIDESIEEGAAGDWKKEGYEIKYIGNHKDAGKFVDSMPHNFNALFPSNLSNQSVYALFDGEIVGYAQLSKVGDNLVPIDLKVKPEHQRKGIASAMYAKAEKESGLKIKKSDNQTDDAKKLWNNPHRQFGEEYSAFGIPLVENLHGTLSPINNHDKDIEWKQESIIKSLQSQRTREITSRLMESKDSSALLSTLKKFYISNLRVASQEIHQYFQQNHLPDTEKRNLISELKSGETQYLKIVSTVVVDKYGQNSFRVAYKPIDGFVDNPSNYRIEFEAAFYPEYSEYLTLVFLRIGPRKEFYNHESIHEAKEPEFFFGREGLNDWMHSYKGRDKSVLHIGQYRSGFAYTNLPHRIKFYIERYGEPDFFHVISDKKSLALKAIYAEKGKDMIQLWNWGSIKQEAGWKAFEKAAYDAGYHIKDFRKGEIGDSHGYWLDESASSNGSKREANIKKLFQLLKGVSGIEFDGYRIVQNKRVYFDPVEKRNPLGSDDGDLVGVIIKSAFGWAPKYRVMIKNGKIDISKAQQKSDELNAIIEQQFDEWKKKKDQCESIEEVKQVGEAYQMPSTGLLYHLTDNNKFELNPDFAPEDNSISVVDRSGQKGIYLAKNPEYWLNGKNYWRPFLVEFSVDKSVVNDKGVHGKYGGEIFIPTTSFGKISINRVIPIDAYAREEFGSYGWIESEVGKSFDTGEPIGKQIGYPFHGYKYNGKDVRNMSSSEVQKLQVQFNNFLKNRHESVTSIGQSPLKGKSITEAKQVGEVYHMTRTDNLYYLAKSGFKFYSHRKAHVPEYDGQYFVSVTRNPKLKISAGESEEDRENMFANCRIVLDGDAISNKYRVFPYADLEVGRGKHRVMHNEFEEAILIPRGQYKIDLGMYVKRVDVFIDPVVPKHNEKWIDKAVAECKTQGVPVYFTDEFWRKSDPHPRKILKDLQVPEESVQEGASGDWRDKNISFMTDVDAHGIMYVYAHQGYKDNTPPKMVAEFQFVDDHPAAEGKLYVNLAEVESEYRRLGIASEAYRIAEKKWGKKIAPSISQTGDARKLWSQSNRPFGKNESVNNLHGQFSNQLECGKGGIWKRQNSLRKEYSMVSREMKRSLLENTEPKKTILKKSMVNSKELFVADQWNIPLDKITNSKTEQLFQKWLNNPTNKEHQNQFNKSKKWMELEVVSNVLPYPPAGPDAQYMIGRLRVDGTRWRIEFMVLFLPSIEPLNLYFHKLFEKPEDGFVGYSQSIDEACMLSQNFDGFGVPHEECKRIKLAEKPQPKTVSEHMVSDQDILLKSFSESLAKQFKTLSMMAKNHNKEIDVDDLMSEVVWEISQQVEKHFNAEKSKWVWQYTYHIFQAAEESYDKSFHDNFKRWCADFVTFLKAFQRQASWLDMRAVARPVLCLKVESNSIELQVNKKTIQESMADVKALQSRLLSN